MRDDCRDCRLTRRTFVHDVFFLAAGALAIPGLADSPPLALRIASFTGWPGGAQSPSYPIPAQDGVTIDRGNQVILVRYHSHVYAFALSCPHQNTALRWQEAEGRFQCPKHHSKYQPDGVFMSGRATRGMDRYEVRRDGDAVVVNLDHLIRDDKDHAGWLAATIQI
jgi:nitrite reductase/ring-hydroxylating ferredoxin subunit